RPPKRPAPSWRPPNWTGWSWKKRKPPWRARGSPRPIRTFFAELLRVQPTLLRLGRNPRFTFGPACRLISSWAASFARPALEGEPRRPTGGLSMKRLLVVAASALALAGPAMAQSGGQSGPQGAPRADAAANRTEAAIPPPVM